MAGSVSRRPKKKRADRYHHGDLRRALVDEALRTIHTHGVEDLTLRGAGARLGVSRTALYRHFSDKQALVAAVGREGFRVLRLALSDAWQRHGKGRRGFEAMGVAYVNFAVAHPSHYRVMFGRFVESCVRDPEFVQEAEAAFQALVDALVAQQREGLVRRDDPVALARFVWSVVHGVAMLTIDGQLPNSGDSECLPRRYVTERIQSAITAAASS